MQKAAPRLLGGCGSLVLRYRAAVNRALYAAVMVRAEGRPIAFHLDGMEYSFDPTEASREGIWWLPRDSVTDYLILSNLADSTLHASLTLYDSSGKAWRQKLSLGARQTQRFSVRPLLQRARLAGSYGGIKIQADKGAGYLASAHLLFDELGGFSAIMKMFTRDPATALSSRSFEGAKEWTTRAPMLALSDPDPALGFPAGTRLQPRVFVRNASTKSYTAHIHFNWRSVTSIGTTAPIDVVLKANATQVVDVVALQAHKQIPADAHWAAVVLSAPVQPDELLAVASSYDESGRFGAQTPFNDQLAFHWEAGKWEVDSMHNSLVTVGNGGNQAVRAELTILYNQGREQYQMEQKLAPEEQMLVDFGKLIHERIPDKSGRVLPPDLTSGAYRVRDLTDEAVGNLYEGKVIVDKTNGHAAYGCAVCCGYTGPAVVFDPLPVAVAGTSDQKITATNGCSGQRVDVTYDFFDWWTDNTAIATAQAYKITGVAAGSTNHHAQSVLMSWSGKTYVVNAQITGADLENNQVNVTLSGPSGTSGTLEVIAIGVNNQPQVTYNGGAAVGPGSYNVAFNRPTWPADTYSSVKAIWNYDPIPATATFNLTRAWLVLGLIRHSQYNTPYESACSGSPQAAWFFNTSCAFSQTSLKSDFVSQTYINGTGVSQSHGILKYSTSCTNYPPGANSQNSFLTVSNITGACNSTMTGGVSVATYPSPKVGNPYGCGDNALLVTSSNTNEAVKDVVDYCPACSGGFNGTNGHIDDYSSSQACSGNGVGDLGNYWTADTH